MDILYINSVEFKRFYYTNTPTDYYINDIGDVYSLKTKKILSPSLTPEGRLRVCLRINGKDKTLSVHSMVASVFIGIIPKNMTVDHLNEDKKNNHFLNLEIVSAHENIIRYLHNHDNLNMKKYSDSLTHEICLDLKKGIHYVKVAERKNVPIAFVYNLVHSKTRKRIVKNYLPFPIESKQKENRRNRKGLKKMIKSLIEQRMSNKEIYTTLGIEVNNANEKLIIRCRKRLNIKDPIYFDQIFVNSIFKLINSDYSNFQILNTLELNSSERLSCLFTRLRKKYNKPDFNESGLTMDTQNNIIELMMDGKSNKDIEKIYYLNRTPYIINLFGRLRQKAKKENGSTTIEKQEYYYIGPV